MVWFTKIYYITKPSFTYVFVKSWLHIGNAMGESNRHDGNFSCYYTEDVRNWSDAKIADEMLKSPLTSWVIQISMPIIFAIGFVGNVAFLLLLARVKTMRTITNFYLANLAAADLTIIFFETVTKLWQYLDSNQVKSDIFLTNFGCMLYQFAIHTSGLASILLITACWFWSVLCHLSSTQIP